MYTRIPLHTSPDLHTHILAHTTPTGTHPLTYTHPVHTHPVHAHTPSHTPLQAHTPHPRAYTHTPLYAHTLIPTHMAPTCTHLAPVHTPSMHVTSYARNLTRTHHLYA